VEEAELKAPGGAGAEVGWGDRRRGSWRATLLVAGADGDQRCGFLLGAAHIWQRRRHGGGLGGGGGPPAELKAIVASSWVAAASCSGLGAELERRRARFGGVRGRRLLETSVPHRVGPTCLSAHYARAREGVC
jgi:hypothetical protein